MNKYLWGPFSWKRFKIGVAIILPVGLIFELLLTPHKSPFKDSSWGNIFSHIAMITAMSLLFAFTRDIKLPKKPGT